MAQTKRLTFKNKPEHTTWAELEAMWREADGIEHFDGAWLYDHLGPIYGEQTGPCFEGWTALSYFAGITTRLRLGLMVTAGPYRNPGVLAKMATTFDHFSGGRLDLGLGAGWMEPEATAFGMPLLPIGQRLSQFEEACAVVTSLLRNEVTNFDGKYYQMVDARCEPKPLQQPSPPILMGGTGVKRMLKIVARYADDWNYPGGTPEDFAEKLEILHGHCATVGRDPADITPSCHIYVTENPSEVAEQSAAFAEAGARHLCLYFQDNSDPGVIGPVAEAVAAATAD